MAEEEKNELQPQKEEQAAAAEKPAAEVEKISDEEFASILGDSPEKLLITLRLLLEQHLLKMPKHQLNFLLI